MASHKDICIKVGTYTGADGQPKNRYKSIGRLVTKDDGGEFITLDADIFHAGLFALANRERSDRIVCSIFSREEDGPAPKTPPAMPSDDIPF